LLDLYMPESMALDNYVDDCAGESPKASLEQCRRTGVMVSQYGHIPATDSLSNVVNGGNPNLAVETGTTYTVGLVFAPARDLAVTVDYWNIRIDDAIGAVSAGGTMDQCLTTGNPGFCGLITRDPRSGTLWMDGGYVKQININIGTQRTSGADIALSYRLR